MTANDTSAITSTQAKNMMKLARIRSIGAEPGELEEDHGRAGQAGRPAEQAARTRPVAAVAASLGRPW